VTLSSTERQWRWQRGEPFWPGRLARQVAEQRLSTAGASEGMGEVATVDLPVLGAAAPFAPPEPQVGGAAERGEAEGRVHGALLGRGRAARCPRRAAWALPPLLLSPADQPRQPRVWCPRACLMVKRGAFLPSCSWELSGP